MQLIIPSVAYFESYKRALVEFEANGISGFWRFYGPAEDPDAYLGRIRQYEHQAGLDDGMVPESVFWLVDDHEFIGHVSIRHRLNDGLKRIGGHIGYAVRPAAQRKGYGSAILKFALPKARELGIRSALLTCDASNVASRRIIEKNGGKLEKEIEVDGGRVLHFIIEL